MPVADEHGDSEHEEEEDVENTTYSLDERDDLESPGIDDKCECHDQPHDQCRMPALKNIVWIIDNHHCLRLCRDKVDKGCDGRLPREDSHPTLDKRNDISVFLRREHVSEVVLCS